MSFEGGHVHAAQRLRCCMTPCLRYLCMPSEDGSVCAYDVRTGRVLGSHHAHRDVVCAVDVNPRSGCMASGGFDGAVHFYRAKLPAAPNAKGRGRGGSAVVDAQEKGRGPRERVSCVREVVMDLPM